MTRRQSSMINLLLILPLGYLMILAVLYFNQDNMVFVPTRDTEANLDRQAAAEGFEPWFDAQGKRIGWQSRGGDDSQVLLICGGNGGYALNRTHYRSDLSAQGCNWKIFLVEYPGYGARPGKPGEKALTEAAIEAFDTLAARPDRTIRVVGASLGSGVPGATGLRGWFWSPPSTPSPMPPPPTTPGCRFRFCSAPNSTPQKTSRPTPAPWASSLGKTTAPCPPNWGKGSLKCTPDAKSAGSCRMRDMTAPISSDRNGVR